MRAVPEGQKFLIAAETAGAPDLRGWYHHVLNVAETPEGLLCVYRRTDSHTAVISDILTARSRDGGRTWTDHTLVAHSDVWVTRGLWVAPQLTRLADGRLVVICDLGNRNSGQDWPMLSRWQRPERGMSNHLFWSHDHGRTWDGPYRIDGVGGEPGYICELSDGTLVYTRTESAPTDAIWNPPLPWGPVYYRSVAVFSDDGGQTWERTAVLTDDPLQSDCEVGLVETAPGHLLAVTRIGLGGGVLGQPSRIVRSADGGRTWGQPALSPLYGARPAVHRLRSGDLLATFRNVWGTPGTYALRFGPDEPLPYEPASFIWDESRCTLAGGAMILDTVEGREGGVVFALYPAQAPDSRVEVTAELRVEHAAQNGCALSAGCWVHVSPERVWLGDRPEAGFPLDATRWHTYRLLREGGRIHVQVDGETRLEAPTDGLETRLVHFGNRQGRGWTVPHGLTPADHRVPLHNAARSHWRALAVSVENGHDHSVRWSWRGADGYPDRFRRERMLCLDRNGSFVHGNNGYSGWTQTADGSIVIADYTTGDPPAAVPFARAYVLREEDLP